MLSWLSRMLGFKQKGRTISARYDAAQTTAENSNHWAYADSLSAQAANSSAVRLKLRTRARYEYANNCYLHGMIRTLATRTIGTGPTLQVKTGDQAIDNLIERAWSRWFKAAKIAKKLHTMRIARCRDGEVFGLMINNPNLPGPVQLDLSVVEADQVYSPFNFADTPTHCDGIDFDVHGNPLQYYFAKQHPGSAFGTGIAVADFDKHAAQFVIHQFQEDRPGQRRGVPEITPALPLFAISRRYTLATVIAAETAANIAAYMKTPAAGADDTDELTNAPFQNIDIQRGTMMTLPEGWDIAQLKAEHPTTTHADFTKSLIREQGRCLGMPFNIAAADSSSYNYASGRLDGQNFDMQIAVDRMLIANDLDRLLDEFLNEAALAGVIPQVQNIEHEWRWPAGRAIDPQTEATANKINLSSGAETLPSLYAKEGLDFQSELAKGAEALGMTVQEYQALLAQSLFANGNPQQPAQQQGAANEQPATA